MMPAGLYIHIPFCRQKCAYCDFYSITDFSLKQPYFRALLREIKMIEPIAFSFDSIYIGGGTPSLFEPKEIEVIIETVNDSVAIQPKSEITIEINPGTVDENRLIGYRSAGVNRISIGVQSFQDTHLQVLSRVHTGKESDTAIKASQIAF